MIYKSGISIDKQIFDSAKPPDDYIQKQLWLEAGKAIMPQLTINQAERPGVYEWQNRIDLTTRFVFIPMEQLSGIFGMLNVLEGELTARGLPTMANIVRQIGDEIVNK